MPSHDERRVENRARVARAGAYALERHAIQALRDVLTPSALADGAGVSRDTAYRVFKQREGELPTPDNLIEAVTEAAMAPRLQGYYAAEEAIADRDRPEPFDTDDTASVVVERFEFFEAFLEAMIQQQFSNDLYCARLLLHACSLPASPLFSGVTLDDADRELAEHILHLRASAYRAMRFGIVQMTRVGMSALGRRPRAGVSLDQIAGLMQALIDGSVLRMSIEPTLLSPGDVARAILAMCVELTEPGGVRDPRRPVTETLSRLFDHVLGTAIAMWESDRQRTYTIDEIMAAATVDEPGVSGVGDSLPSLADIADSALRLRVDAGGQFSTVESEYELSSSAQLDAWSDDVRQRIDDYAGTAANNFDLDDSPPQAPGAHRQGALTALAQALSRLVYETEHIPQAFDALANEAPRVGGTFIDDLRRGAARILLDPDVTDSSRAATQAEVLSELLIDAAVDRDNPTIEKLLRGAGYGLEPTVPRKEHR